MAGHSLGEYSALVCAESIAFADAVTLVAERARLMQAAVPQGQGAMAAILGLKDEQVQAVCAEITAAGEIGEIVEAVNMNAPGQVVIAGHANAVVQAGKLAKAAGAKRVLPLPVSVPSHCALMKPAAEKLAAYLTQIHIKPPKIPIVHNASVETTQDPEQIRKLLALQLHRPVRWVETIQALAANEVTTLIEAGPGKVLTGLNKRINTTMQVWPVFDPETLDRALQETAHVT
jgi:[acyl-carrier-protein] S-malonyltransferase